MKYQHGTHEGWAALGLAVKAFNPLWLPSSSHSVICPFIAFSLQLFCKFYAYLLIGSSVVFRHTLSHFCSLDAWFSWTLILTMWLRCPFLYPTSSCFQTAFLPGSRQLNRWSSSLSAKQPFLVQDGKTRTFFTLNLGPAQMLELLLVMPSLDTCMEHPGRPSVQMPQMAQKAVLPPHHHFTSCNPGSIFK